MTNSSKKGSNRNEDKPSFSELLKKQCPWHPHNKHVAIDCYTLRKVIKHQPEPPSSNNNNNNKGKGKVDEGKNGEDKFQTPSKNNNNNNNNNRRRLGLQLFLRWTRLIGAVVRCVGYFHRHLVNVGFMLRLVPRVNDATRIAIQPNRSCTG